MELNDKFGGKKYSYGISGGNNYLSQENLKLLLYKNIVERYTNVI